MDSFNKLKELPKSPLLSEIPAIVEGRNKTITAREQIKELVEKPLLEACQIMYDKNIRTLATSANKKDIEVGEVYIIIDFDNLSEQNKIIAQKYNQPFNHDDINAVIINIKINNLTTSKEIEQKSIEIANNFHKQSADWIAKYTLEDLKNIYRIELSDTRFDDPTTWTDFYYDEKNKLFYLSEEHYKKANEKIN